MPPTCMLIPGARPDQQASPCRRRWRRGGRRTQRQPRPTHSQSKPSGALCKPSPDSWTASSSRCCTRLLLRPTMPRQGLASGRPTLALLAGPPAPGGCRPGSQAALRHAAGLRRLQAQGAVSSLHSAHGLCWPHLNTSLGMQGTPAEGAGLDVTDELLHSCWAHTEQARLGLCAHTCCVSLLLVDCRPAADHQSNPAGHRHGRPGPARGAVRAAAPRHQPRSEPGPGRHHPHRLLPPGQRPGMLPGLFSSRWNKPEVTAKDSACYVHAHPGILQATPSSSASPVVPRPWTSGAATCPPTSPTTAPPWQTWPRTPSAASRKPPPTTPSR